jgi:hypothetical protein
MSIATIKRTIDKANRQYAKELESLCRAATIRLSKCYKAEVTFCSAMGTWGWSIDGKWDEISEDHRAIRTAAKAMDEAQSDYGWNPIPVVSIKAQGGKITEVKYDW